MADAIVRSYPSISDGRLLSIFASLLEQDTVEYIDVRLAGDQSRRLQSTSDIANLETEYSLKSTRLVNSATLVNQTNDNRSNMSVVFRRAKSTWVTESNRVVRKFIASQLEIEVEVQTAGSFTDNAFNVMRAFEAGILDSGFVPEVTLPNEMMSALSSHAEAFAAASAKAYDDARNARKDAEREIAKLRKQQDKEFAERKSLADEELGAIRSELKDRQTDLSKRLKEVDDRTNMHARRAKAEQIGARLKSRLEEESVGADVKRIRALITGVAMSALALSAMVLLSGLVEFFPNLASESNLNTQIFASARVAGGSAAFFLVLFYLLAFLRRIASEDAAARQQLERYSLDMDRSSWAIETVLEVQARSDDVSVPQEWMEGVTNNLFGDTSKEEEEKTALEALGEILQRGAAIKMGSDGIEMDLNARAARKVGKTGT